jgi:hypothetical protein
LPRPQLQNSDITRWNLNILNDSLANEISQNAILKEICYAGYWLTEQLTLLKCHSNIIDQIIYSSGTQCFSQPDPWIIHQNMLNHYLNNELEFDFSED